MKPRHAWAMPAMIAALVLSSPLYAQEKAGSSRTGPSDLGDSQADLLYTPVAPCRIIDTRLADGPIAGGTASDFKVTGTDLSFQGGSATGCGIPFGPATAAVINFVAVNPTGPGDLRIAPIGTPMPTASILNYAAVPGLNIANGATVAICDPLVGPCSMDFRIQADGGATHLVADVQGYFRNLRVDQLPTPSNPNQVAILRWYAANQTADFTVGTNPGGVAFDGANVWVTGFATSDVTKLRTSDGTNLGTFPVGPGPYGVAFDGANIWVTNLGGDSVTKLRASDGANLGTFPVGAFPHGVAFDGANIWVVNQTSSNVTKLRATDGANLGTFPVGNTPHGLAFDGANIWVANVFSNNVTKLRASDGTNVGTFPVGSGPIGVAFDGANIWVTDGGGVTKLRATDGTNLGTFAAGGWPYGVAFDGANIWVTNFSSNTVSKR